MEETEEIKEVKKTKLGVQFIAGYTWLVAFIFGFFTVRLLLILTQDPRASDIGFGIFALTISSVLAFLFGNLAVMTSTMKPIGWWGQMIVSLFSIFILSSISTFNSLILIPIIMIMMIYLWINRESFGIPMNKGGTDH